MVADMVREGHRAMARTVTRLALCLPRGRVLFDGVYATRSLETGDLVGLA